MKKLFIAAVLMLACALPASADSRVFELRTYHVAPGKLDLLHQRFKETIIPILEKNGATVVGFWVPMDADKGSADTLVYILAFKDRDAAAAAWKAFRSDPEWVKKSAESGPLTTKVESVFLSPTDYSPMK